MKKTLVALAVTAFAVSANAATIYNNDGTEVKLGGRFTVAAGQFGKDDNGKYQRLDLRSDSTRFQLDIKHDLGAGFSALAQYRLDFAKDDHKKDADHELKTKRLFIGFANENVGTLTFGRQLTNGDEVQLNDPAYIFGGNNNLQDFGNKVVKFRSADFNLGAGSTLGFGADYTFGDSDKKEYKSNGYGVAAFYALDLNDFGFKANAGYTVDNNGVYKSKAWRLATLFTVGPVDFGAEFGQTRIKQIGAKYDKYDSVLASVQYHYLDNANVYGEYMYDRFKINSNASKGAQHTYLLGTDYKLTNNVITFAEYAHVRANSTVADKERDNKFVIGARILF